MAATDLERLVVQLSADLKGYQNSLSKARGITNRQMGQIQKQAASTGKAMTASLVQAGAAVAGAFVFTDVIRGIGNLSEAATRIDNSLKVAGLSGAELERVYEGLSKAAIANGAPIETLTSLYSRAAQAQKELGVTSGELLNFTNNVALALRVAGTDAQAASGALLQLGQALGSGKVQAEEFNSILEGAPTIAQAAAAGLKEAGGSVSQLKQLIVDGQISSEAFFRAFEAGSVILEQKAANATFTIAQATNNLWTSLTNVVREFNQSTGASERFAHGINNAAGAIDDFDVSGLIKKIQDADTAFRDFLANNEGLNAVLDTLNRISGVTDAAGNVINVDKEPAEDAVKALEREVELLQATIEKNTNLGFDNTEAVARLNEVLGKLAEVRAAAAAIPDTVAGYQLGENGIEAVPESGSTSLGGPRTRGGKRKKAAVNPVSLPDFKPPPSRGGRGGGRSRGGGRGGSGSADELQREIEQIQERTAAIQAETAAQAGLNPLLNDFGYAVEFAASKQDLLNAAKSAGKEITPELAAQIDTLAAGYANASSAAEKLAATQDRVREQAEFFGDAFYDAFSELIPKIETGNKALDKFLNTLIEAVAQAAILGKGPFGAPGGGGSGGILGGLLGAIFPFAKGGIAAHGRPQPLKKFARGGVSRSAAIFGEAGPEAAVPLPDGRSIPVKFKTPAIPKRSGAGQQAVDVQVGVTVDDDGKLQAYVKRESNAAVTTAAPRILSAANQQAPAAVSKYQQQKGGAEWR
ncbi:tape measure protein [Sinorhizobium fredii]|uniref:tape measure protein n=1 Tax=Rhizobium fredii TaxID=380 RepID=UPI0004B05A1F|nr:tape measure protein [Sinorhizobium fredii]AWM24977.1 Phage tail length tape-measure protein [Sinorhizobium fredii CCBAU 25509]